MAQLPLPFALDQAAFHTFLAQWNAIENELARLTEEKALLRAAYKDQIPVRAIATALKVVRARQKLAAHAKEPLALVHQTTLEGLVEDRLAAQVQELSVPLMGDPAPTR